MSKMSLSIPRYWPSGLTLTSDKRLPHAILFFFQFRLKTYRRTKSNTMNSVHILNNMILNLLASTNNFVPVPKKILLPPLP